MQDEVGHVWYVEEGVPREGQGPQRPPWPSRTATRLQADHLRETRQELGNDWQRVWGHSDVWRPRRPADQRPGQSRQRKYLQLQQQYVPTPTTGGTIGHVCGRAIGGGPNYGIPCRSVIRCNLGETQGITAGGRFCSDRRLVITLRRGQPLPPPARCTIRARIAGSSMPNGAHSGHGRGRACVEPGPTPAPWRSAPSLLIHRSHDIGSFPWQPTLMSCHTARKNTSCARNPRQLSSAPMSAIGLPGPIAVTRKRSRPCRR